MHGDLAWVECVVIDLIIKKMQICICTVMNVEN